MLVASVEPLLMGPQNHTMIRVKDHQKSLEFYQEVFGMTLIRTVEKKDSKINLYLLGYKGVPSTSANDREGLLELAWSYGTESDPDFKYHNGNSQPQGFGHIGMTQCCLRIS